MKTTSVRRIKPHTSGLSGSALKIIALTTMIIDHTGFGIVARLPGISDTDSAVYAVYWIMRLIGRCAFPIYCFLLTEGIKYTRSRLKYVLRMFVFCLISEIPFDLALYGKLIAPTHQNVFWTLCLGVLMLWAFEDLSPKVVRAVPAALLKAAALILPAAYFTYRTVYYIHRYTSIAVKDYILYIAAAAIWIYLLYSMISGHASRRGESAGLKLCCSLLILAVFMLAADLGHTDYSSAGILTIAVMYVYRKDHVRQMLAGCTVLTVFSNPTEMTSFVTVPLLRHYNGTRGHGFKYVFYIAYPLHLMVIYLIAVLTGLVSLPVFSL